MEIFLSSHKSISSALVTVFLSWYENISPALVRGSKGGQCGSRCNPGVCRSHLHRTHQLNIQRKYWKSVHNQCARLIYTLWYHMAEPTNLTYTKKNTNREIGLKNLPLARIHLLVGKMQSPKPPGSQVPPSPQCIRNMHRNPTRTRLQLSSYSFKNLNRSYQISPLLF